MGATDAVMAKTGVAPPHEHGKAQGLGRVKGHWSQTHVCNLCCSAAFCYNHPSLPNSQPSSPKLMLSAVRHHISHILPLLPAVCCLPARLFCISGAKQSGQVAPLSCLIVPKQAFKKSAPPRATGQSRALQTLFLHCSGCHLFALGGALTSECVGKVSYKAEYHRADNLAWRSYITA